MLIVKVPRERLQSQNKRAMVLSGEATEKETEEPGNPGVTVTAQCRANPDGRSEGKRDTANVLGSGHTQEGLAHPSRSS